MPISTRLNNISISRAPATISGRLLQADNLNSTPIHQALLAKETIRRSYSSIIILLGDTLFDE